MANFNDLLARYLIAWGEYAREHGHDIEWRGNQYEMISLAEIVRLQPEDESLAIEKLIQKLDELDEAEEVW